MILRSSLFSPVTKLTFAKSSFPVIPLSTHIIVVCCKPVASICVRLFVARFFIRNLAGVKKANSTVLKMDYATWFPFLQYFFIQVCYPRTIVKPGLSCPNLFTLYLCLLLLCYHNLFCFQLIIWTVILCDLFYLYFRRILFYYRHIVHFLFFIHFVSFFFICSSLSSFINICYVDYFCVAVC